MSGELTHVLHRALTSAFKKNRITVTVEQFSILALLFYRDGINQQEIGANLNRNKTTITRVISIMERNKLIVRVTDKDDSRGNLIFLTPKGKAIQKRAIEHSGALYMKAISGIANTELAQGASLLTRIIQNLK
ncbi:MAG: MarR family transcriptional regulator [Chryseolinea sp.]